MRMCTSSAPASRSIATTCFVVVPRTIESSTTTRRLPRIESGSGFSFSFTPRSRSDCDGLDERAARRSCSCRCPSPYGMPLTSLYPWAAECPVVGTAITMSASTGCSRAEDAAHLAPGLVHGHLADPRVRPRQVHVLEDAQGLAGRLGEPHGVQAAVVDADQLAGLDVAHEHRADDVQRARLGRDDEAVGQAADRERPDAVGVARRVHATARPSSRSRTRPRASAAPASPPPRGRRSATISFAMQGGDQIGVGRGVSWRAGPRRRGRWCSRGCRCDRGPGSARRRS